MTNPAMENPPMDTDTEMTEQEEQQEEVREQRMEMHNRVMDWMKEWDDFVYDRLFSASAWDTSPNFNPFQNRSYTFDGSALEEFPDVKAAVGPLEQVLLEELRALRRAEQAAMLAYQQARAEAVERLTEAKVPTPPED